MSMAVQSPAYAAFSPRRVAAIVLRHWYLLKSSWPRVFDLMYWPLLQMVVWGFITVFLARHSSWMVQAGGLLIGAVLLWDVLVRGQFGMTLSFLEEMWSRNLANLFVSPLRPFEFAIALCADDGGLRFERQRLRRTEPGVPSVEHLARFGSNALASACGHLGGRRSVAADDREQSDCTAARAEQGCGNE